VIKVGSDKQRSKCKEFSMDISGDEKVISLFGLTEEPAEVEKQVTIKENGKIRKEVQKSNLSNLSF